MKDYYAARAAEYDRIYSKPERQTDLGQLQLWLPGVLEDRSVLEVACGTGYWTQFYAAIAKKVVALDAAVETLDIARERGVPGDVTWMVGDAYQLPKFDTPFSAAFAGFWWSHIPLDQIDGFLRGLHVALEPGASVVFMDNRYVAGSSTPLAETDDAGNTYQIRHLDDGSSHRVLKNFPTESQLYDAVSAYSFSSEYLELDYFWALRYTLR